MSARISSPFRRISRLLVISLLGAAALLCSPASFGQFNGPGPAVETPTTATVTTDRALLFPAAREAQLAAGDLITIHVFEQGDYAPEVRLSNQGTVVLPLIGRVQLAGLTVTQAEQYIEQRLKDAGIYRNPQVTIQLVEGPNQAATVAGEVHSVVPIVGSRRLLATQPSRRHGRRGA